MSITTQFKTINQTALTISKSSTLQKDNNINSVSPLNIKNLIARTHFNFFAVADQSADNKMNKMKSQFSNDKIKQVYQINSLKNNIKNGKFISLRLNNRFKVRKQKNSKSPIHRKFSNNSFQQDRNTINIFTYSSNNNIEQIIVPHKSNHKHHRSTIVPNIGHKRNASLDKKSELLKNPYQSLLSPTLKDQYLKPMCKTLMSKTHYHQQKIKKIDRLNQPKKDCVAQTNFLISKKKLQEHSITVTKLISKNAALNEQKDQEMLNRFRSTVKSYKQGLTKKYLDIGQFKRIHRKQQINDILPWDFGYRVESQIA